MGLRLVNEANLKLIIKRNRKRLSGNFYSAFNTAVTVLLKDSIHRAKRRKTVSPCDIKLLIEELPKEIGDVKKEAPEPKIADDGLGDNIIWPKDKIGDGETINKTDVVVGKGC